MFHLGVDVGLVVGPVEGDQPSRTSVLSPRYRLVDNPKEETPNSALASVYKCKELDFFGPHNLRFPLSRAPCHSILSHHPLDLLEKVRRQRPHE